MDLQLAGQVAFVAGSSRGIGRRIAAALLQEGASVILTARDEDSLRAAESELVASSTSDRVLAIPTDITTSENIAKALDLTLQRFGRLDHMIANVGSGSGKPGWEQEEQEWQRLFELNFFASTRLAQAAMPHLAQNPEGGSLLLISSIVALEATQAPLPYSAAKAALNNYAKNLARQVASQKVRVNTIAPGNIYFPGGSWEKHLSSQREAVETMLKTEVPQQRFGTPEEIASLAAYLCSAKASFATGGCYVMDGGQTRAL